MANQSSAEHPGLNTLFLPLFCSLNKGSNTSRDLLLEKLLIIIIIYIKVSTNIAAIEQ
jgi:hypothetical protein